MSETLECYACGRHYRRVFSRREFPGRRCATLIENGLAGGHYGSKVADGQQFELIGLQLPELSVLCDDCVSAYVRSGALVPIIHNATMDDDLRDFLKSIE